MRLSFLFIITLILACKPEQPKQSPNIILILADDLGYGETGAYGQEKIETPHIDKLAATGLRFTQFYSGAPVCAPARSVLLTGLHSGHTPIRGNHEWAERGPVWDFEKASKDPNLEGQYPMPDTVSTLAKELKKSGYTTAMVGKWGLGGPLSNSIPNTKGFDYFMGYNCQRQAHTYYPLHLWENREKVKLNNELVAPGTKLDEEANIYNWSSYSPFNQDDYAPDIMHHAALDFIENQSDSPFFLYYASPIPHMPLQAPENWIDYYREKFGAEEPYLGNRGYFPSLYPKATYAAMISRLDEQVGEIIQKLDEKGIRDNTIILFTSDNGPTYNGGTDSPWFGSGGPFRSEYGWGKGFLKEGGIRVPLIVNWSELVNKGATTDHIGSFQDFLPTLLELSGHKEKVLTDGVSFAPMLLGKSQPEHNYLYWEFPEYGGQQAVRLGKWKAIRSNLRNDKEITFELFDLSSDPTESNDVSIEFPEVIDSIKQIMGREHIESPIDRFKFKSLGDDIN